MATNPQSKRIPGKSPVLTRKLRKAKRPVIYAGGGVIAADAFEELTKLAEVLKIPVTTTLMGLGGFPATISDGSGNKVMHPLWLGMLGMQVNNWLKTFAAQEAEITPTPTPPGQDQLGYRFAAALGGRYDAAFPSPHEWELEYTPKIKLQLKRDKSGGGCG